MQSLVLVGIIVGEDKVVFSPAYRQTSRELYLKLVLFSGRGTKTSSKGKLTTIVVRAVMIHALKA